MKNNEMNFKYIGRHVFDLAMKLAFTSEYKEDKLDTVKGYKIFNNRMFLFSYISEDAKDVISLPYEMEFTEINEFVWGWLQKTTPAGDEPDTDGSIEKGFRITTDKCDWRGGISMYGSFISIDPIWIVYGK